MDKRVFNGLIGRSSGVYFVGITLFGLWMARKIRTSGAYFLGDRNLPWWVMVGQSFGTGTNAENPVAQAGRDVYQRICHDLVSVEEHADHAVLLAPGPVVPAAVGGRRSPRSSKTGTAGSWGLVYTLMAITFFVCVQGSMLKGGGKVVAAAIGGNLVTPNEVVLAISAAFILYSFFGGADRLGLHRHDPGHDDYRLVVHADFRRG